MQNTVNISNDLAKSWAAAPFLAFLVAPLPWSYYEYV